MEIKPLTFTPQLIIKEEVFNKLLNNVRNTTLEMTFILHINRIKDTPWSFEAVGVHFPPQWNEAAESKTIDSQYPKWCFNKIKNEKVILNGHGHTHPKMSVNPSGYDVNFFNELVKDTNTFQFRLIANHKGNIRCDLIDREKGFICNEVPVIVPCQGFNLVVGSNNYSIEVTDTAQLSILELNEDFSVTLVSEFISVNPKSINTTVIEGEELFKETRKYQTDEGKPNFGYTANKHARGGSEDTYQTNIYDYMAEEDEYMRMYDMERGYIWK